MSMSTAGHSPLSAVEAFVHGQIDLVALEDELDDCCANDESAAWDALALLDQFYRRGRIADADFRALRKRVNRYAQKPLGAASYRDSSTRKGAASRFRSTLTIPVGEELPREAAPPTNVKQPESKLDESKRDGLQREESLVAEPLTGAVPTSAAGSGKASPPRVTAKEEPLRTQVLLHPDSLDLDFNLDSGFDPKRASPALDAALDPDLDANPAMDLPPMHTRELPAREEPLAATQPKIDSTKTLLLGRAEPTVMLDRSPSAYLRDELSLSALDEAPAHASSNAHASSKERDTAARPIDPTMHEGHRVLRDRFELGPLLGRGGMASVFQARDRHREGASEREQWVAVKILNDGVIRAEEGARALQREFQHVQMLTHPSIVKVLDFDYDGATPFLVMELLEGESLESMLARGERFSRRAALGLVHHLAVALGYAHSHDIVHADFKPGNVMVMPSGQVKVLDLGVSWRWQREPRLAAEEGRGSLLATPAYASQEVLNGGLPEVRDDIFSLGCLTYELLMGEHPFRRIPITKAVGQGLHPKRIGWLSRQQWRTLSSSLSWSRDERPASVQAFLDGLGLRGEPPVLQPPSKWSPAEASRVPTVIRFAIAAAACALVAVAVFPQWLRGAHIAAPLATVPVRAADGAGVAPVEPASNARVEPSRVETPVVPQSKPVPLKEGSSTASTEPAPRATAAPVPLDSKPIVSSVPPAAAAAMATSAPALSAAPTATTAQAAARPGRIAFARSTFNVNEGDALARIELVRSRGSLGKVGVHWETEDVTAVKDTDYADMGQQVAWFDNGQTRLTLLVPLVVGGEAKDLRAFRVRIKDPEGGAELSDETEAMVVIADK